MANRADIKIELTPEDLEKLERSIVSAVLLDARMAVGSATKKLEKWLEDETKAKVRGRLWRAWASNTYPRRAVPSYMPVGEVYVNGGSRTRGAVTYWSVAGVNRSEQGFYRAIPLPAAGQTTRDRNLTPAIWERRNGQKLTFVYQPPPKASFLMAKAAVGSLNGLGIARRGTKRRLDQGREAEDIPIFILIKEQKHANTVVVEPYIRRARDEMAEDFRARIRRGARSAGI